MTAVLLSGESSPADPACALGAEVERQLAVQFDTVRSFHLAGYDIGHCMGEFDCFVKTPGAAVQTTPGVLYRFFGW